VITAILRRAKKTVTKGALNRSPLTRHGPVDGSIAKVFGGFGEHLGRCIDGGRTRRARRSATTRGFR